jgi:hypothetical protein
MHFAVSVQFTFTGLPRVSVPVNILGSVVDMNSMPTGAVWPFAVRSPLHDPVKS